MEFPPNLDPDNPDEEFHPSDWKERLRNAQTDEDFHGIRNIIRPWSYSRNFAYITSPVILRMFIRDHEPPIERSYKIFYHIAYNFRIDLIEVFFSEGIFTLDDLESPIEHSDQDFPNLIGNIIEDGYVDLMTFFLDKGLDINSTLEVRGWDEECLLTQACIDNKIDIVSLLIKRGADVNFEDDEGNTPIFNATWHSDIGIIDLLIVNGANLFHRNKKGETIWNTKWYCGRFTPNLQRLVEFGVHLPEEEYIGALKRYEKYPEMEGVILTMKDVMKGQGSTVD